jgi:hypothetical protein
MESRRIPKTLETNLMGQNSMACGVSLYHWKALGTQMSKMGSHCSFGHLKHKLWPKEGLGVKLPVWLLTRKVGNRSDLLSCKQRATYRWKALDETYNFASTSPRSEVCSQSYWAPKSQECPLARFQDSHAGVPGEKSHLDVGPVERSRVYYNGEGGSFPQVWAVVSLVCSCCPWLVLTPKVLQLCTNHFVWFVCRPCEWVSLSTLPSPIPELQHAPLPLKVLWARERASTPPSSDVFHLDSHLSCSRSWECVIDR